MDNELMLFDRLEVIKTTIAKYGEDNFYLSFSGGKDSTLLHHLLDEALPNNRIPRVYIDTGIEYLAIREFVLNMAKKDDRFVIIKPSKPIKQTLEEYGYPFKSKEHSLKLHQYQQGFTDTNYIKKYLGNGDFSCPKQLKYQFSKDFHLKVSNLCCYKLKKEPCHKWEKENHRPIAITGMRREEGGLRANIKGCIITDNNGKVKKFHPLLVVTDEWEEWYRERESATSTALLSAFQLQEDRLQGLSVQPRPARATIHYEFVSPQREGTMRIHLEACVRRVSQNRIPLRQMGANEVILGLALSSPFFSALGR